MQLRMPQPRSRSVLMAPRHSGAMGSTGPSSGLPLRSRYSRKVQKPMAAGSSVTLLSASTRRVRFGASRSDASRLARPQPCSSSVVRVRHCQVMGGVMLLGMLASTASDSALSFAAASRSSVGCAFATAPPAAALDSSAPPRSNRCASSGTAHLFTRMTLSCERSGSSCSRQSTLAPSTSRYCSEGNTLSHTDDSAPKVLLRRPPSPSASPPLSL
mmetsp:Transcript_27119/g.85314  ORF Transcript_27119/g.85314 Transcript_27119/m.85314 type:complete len:215 (-) Transcript_27119:273-917(-)